MDFFKNWRTYMPAVLFVGFGLFLFAPVLFFGQAFLGEEQIGFYYPLAHFVWQALHTGTSLLWNGADYGGVTTNFDQFASTWNPVNLFLFSVLPFFIAHHASIFIGTVVGLVATYLFGRRQEWGVPAASTLALCYLSATTFGWLEVGTLSAYSFMVLPILLICIEKMAEAFRVKSYALWLALAGAAIGFGFVAGTAQIMFYNCTLVGLYALYLDWSAYRASASYAGKVLVGMALAGVVGLVLAMPQWVPSALLINLTTRTGDFAAVSAVTPYPTELITFVIPPYVQVPFFGGGSAQGFYIGALGLVCALLALRYYRTERVLVWGAAYLVAAAFAFHIPLFSWINEHIPPFSHMSGNVRWLVAGAFPLAYLAAAGVEGLMREPERISRRMLKVYAALCGIVAGALLLGGLALSIVVSYVERSPEVLSKLLSLYTHGRALQFTEDHYITVLKTTLQDTTAMFSITSPHLLFAAFCWCLAAAFFILMTRDNKQKWRPVAAIACSVIAVAGTWMLQWSDLVPQQIYTQTPAIVTYLTQHESDTHAYRTLGFVVGDGLFAQVFSHHTPTSHELATVYRETLVQDSNLLFGIDQMDGMKAFRTKRVDTLLGEVVGIDSQSTVTNADGTTSSVTLDQKIQDFVSKLPLVSMMNVKYIYSPYQLTTPLLRLVYTAPLIQGASLYLYENDRVVPRMYFPKTVHFSSDTDQALLDSIVQTKDFSADTWIECASCQNESSRGGEVKVLSYNNGNIQLSTETPTPRWLVLSESYMPGWHATIDGAPADIYRANYLFEAVKVPEGNHSISFTYSDPTLWNRQ